MPTTSNFGWTTPADTDLVKDGASAIRTLGNGIDTSLVDLKGGTSGQYLKKNTNTDLDFVWSDPGDISEVLVSSPITGGGSTGSVTISIQDATTAQKGAVQLTDSTSSTSTTTAATPNSVKSAYDLANGAVAKSLLDAKGDLIAASANDTPAKLTVGSNNHILIADSAETTGLKWGYQKFRGVSCTKNVNQSIASGTWTSIDFETEDFDSDAFHSTSTNISRITIPSGLDGYYRFSGIVDWQTTGANARRARLRVNGTTTYDLLNMLGMAAGETLGAFNLILNLVATDYVEIQAYQADAGNIDIEQNSRFQAEFLGV